MRQMRICVVSDDRSFRARLEGIVSSQPDFQLVAGVAAADLIVIDADGNEVDVGTISRADVNGPKRRILLIGSTSEEIGLLRAWDAGVSGYMPKSSSPARIVYEIRTAFRGGRYLSTQTSRPSMRGEHAIDAFAS
jgi:DNA-binding NarL/FixJ family response regulator